MFHTCQQCLPAFFLPAYLSCNCPLTSNSCFCFPRQDTASWTKQAHDSAIAHHLLSHVCLFLLCPLRTTPWWNCCHPVLPACASFPTFWGANAGMSTSRNCALSNLPLTPSGQGWTLRRGCISIITPILLTLYFLTFGLHQCRREYMCLLAS